MNDKRTENAMRDRMNWLKGWLKMREYNIGSKRRDFLFVYYCTVIVLYPHNLAVKMTHNRNNSFTEPLKEDMVEHIIEKVDKKVDKRVNAKVEEKGKYKFSNQHIINRLGITEQEVEELRIGHHLKECEERTRRMFYNLVLEAEIVKRFLNGESITQIANEVREFSKSKIERILKDYAKQKKMERNKQIIYLKKLEKKESEIANLVNCDVKTVKTVLEREKANREKPSNFVITDKLKEVSELPLFSDTDNLECMYSLHKTKTIKATVDDYYQALLTLQTSKRNIFLTGSAGTAKTTLLNEYLKSLSKDEREATVVVAPTGVASEHLGGHTIHYTFKLDTGVLSPEEITFVPKNLLSMRRLIIDEISMVRIDLFEKIIRIIKFIEKTTGNKIQLIVCGDYSQIAPVVSKEDLTLLKQYYPKSKKSYYPFYSDLWKQMNFQTIRLSYVFRQSDNEYIDRLNQIKYGKIEALDWFNTNCSKKNYNPYAIVICPHKKEVEYYNQICLERYCLFDAVEFKAIENNVKPEDVLPCQRVLLLDVGIRVMTICNSNDHKNDYKNGNLGTIKKVSNDVLEVELDNGKLVQVKRKKFTLDSGATYEQFPVVLGYAISINKSQGLSFCETTIIPGSGFFSAGQLYVALSRCKNPDRLCLLGKLKPKDLIVDTDALEMTI